MSQWIVVAELLQMGDPFSLKRAERKLHSQLDRMFRLGLINQDWLECLLYLARLDWLTKNYDQCLHHLEGAKVLAENLGEGQKLTKVWLGMAHAYSHISQYDKAQEAVIEAVIASKDCAPEFREQTRAAANLVFNDLTRARRNS